MTEPTRRRGAGSLDNDLRILDAALTCARRDGVDALSMRDVAYEAGLRSASPVYGRYESPQELAVVLWQDRCRVAVLELLDTAAANAAGDSLAAETLTHLLCVPSPALQVGVEIVVVARRHDELSEVIVPDVLAWLAARQAEAGTVRRVRAVVCGAAAFALGILLSELPRDVPRTDWTPAVGWQTGLLTLSARPVGDARPLPQPVPVLPGGDPVRYALIRATGEVVARSGYYRTTLQRIARRAGYTTGVVYSRYADREALMADAVDVLVSTTFRAGMDRNAQLLREGGFVAAAAGIMSGHVGPAARPVGRLMTEMHVAAAHHPSVSGALATAHSGTLTEDLQQLGSDDLRLAVVPRGTRAMRLGLYMLDDLLADQGGLADVDFRTFIGPMSQRALADPLLWDRAQPASRTPR